MDTKTVTLAEVWITETGEYEDRYVFSVATSPADAERHIKQRFGPPYRVEWAPLGVDYESGETWYTLTGSFEAVKGYSTQHIASFLIRPMPLVGERP